MLRAGLSIAAVLAAFCVIGMAEDNKGDKSKDSKGIVATFVMADVAKNTVTFKATDKSGKTVELKLGLDKNAKVIDENNKPRSLSDFVRTWKPEETNPSSLLRTRITSTSLKSKTSPKNYKFMINLMPDLKSGISLKGHFYRHHLSNTG